MLFLLTIYFFTYLFFTDSKLHTQLQSFLVKLNYIGVFLGGFFYAYSFTSAPATAVLLSLAKEYNIYVAGFVGGIGALISDILIYLFIKHTFIHEINGMKKEKSIIFINKLRKRFFGPFEKHIIPIIASVFIATPLPTEFGISLMTSFKGLSTNRFILAVYILHTIGIFTILLIGNLTS